MWPWGGDQLEDDKASDEVGLEPTKIGGYCSDFHEYCSNHKMKDYFSPLVQLMVTNICFLYRYAGFVSGRHK